MDDVKRKAKKEITHMFDEVLNYAYVVITDDEQYSRFRARVLRLGNNCIRNLNDYIDERTI